MKSSIKHIDIIENGSFLTVTYYSGTVKTFIRSRTPKSVWNVVNDALQHRQADIFVVTVPAVSGDARNGYKLTEQRHYRIVA